MNGELNLNTQWAKSFLFILSTFLILLPLFFSLPSHCSQSFLTPAPHSQAGIIFAVGLSPLQSYFQSMQCLQLNPLCSQEGPEMAQESFHRALLHDGPGKKWGEGAGRCSRREALILISLAVLMTQHTQVLTRPRGFQLMMCSFFPPWLVSINIFNKMPL